MRFETAVLCALVGSALMLEGVGCSSDSESEGGGGNGGNSGSAAASGNAGSIQQAGASNDGGFDPDSGCVGFSQGTENTMQPADIVMAVDQSTSMTEETQFIQTQLNAFAAQIEATGVDARLVLIAERPSGYDPALDAYDCQGEEFPAIENPICIPTPLAGANCGDNTPRYRSLNCHVDSHDAFDKILGLHEVYAPSLRNASALHVVVVTDDDPNMTGAQFDAALKALNPNFSNYFFHAIVPFTNCSYAAGSAQQYLDLVAQTGGVSGDLCQQDFQPVWDALSQHVAQNVKLACEWTIPPPPAGQALDPNKINVRYTDTIGVKDLDRVDSMVDCGSSTSSWYYDDNTSPTKVIACPELCKQIQAGSGQQVEIVFGCATKITPPA